MSNVSVGRPVGSHLRLKRAQRTPTGRGVLVGRPVGSHLRLKPLSIGPISIWLAAVGRPVGSHLRLKPGVNHDASRTMSRWQTRWFSSEIETRNCIISPMAGRGVGRPVGSHLRLKLLSHWENKRSRRALADPLVLI